MNSRVKGAADRVMDVTEPGAVMDKCVIDLHSTNIEAVAEPGRQYSS